MRHLGDTVRFRTLLLVTGLVFAACGVAIGDISDGLVAWYPLDGSADDASGNGNNGTVVGGTFCEDRFGNTDGAIYLDGLNDYVNIGSGVKPPLPLTMAAWVKLSSLEQCTLVRNDVQDASAYRHGAALRIMSYGQVRGYLFSGYASVATRIAKCSVDSLAVAGEWHLFVVVFRAADDIELYWDGLEVEGVYEGGGDSMTYSTGDGALGHHRLNNPVTDVFLHGCLDDVRIYDRALSPEEIGELLCDNAYDTDVSVRVTAEPDTVEMSDAWTTSFVVENRGPSSASEVEIDYALPLWTHIESATASQGTCVPGWNTVECDLGDVAVGDSATVDVVASVQGIVMTADVSVVSPSDIGDPSDNSASCWNNAACPSAAVRVARSWAASAAAATGRGTDRDLSAGLLARYTFSGTWEDVSGHGNDGTPYGGASFATDRFGAAGQACGLGGVEDYVDIGSGVKPELPATVCLWLQEDPSGGTGVVFTTDDGCYGTGQGLRLEYWSGFGVYAVLCGGSPDSCYMACSSVATPPGEWHHFAAVFQAPDDIHVYWDGVETSPSFYGSASRLAYSDGPGALGRDSSSYNFSGSLDGVCVYDRALSPGEIEELYSSAADLSVVLDGPSGAVSVGEDVTYEATVSNSGIDVASAVVLFGELGPPGTVAVSATPSQGSCLVDGRTVTCDLGDIDASAQATVGIVANLTVLDIEGTASVSSSLCDENPGNNGVWTRVSAVCGGTSVPEGGGASAASIDGARPNPFGSHTTLTFSLAGRQHVTVAVYDLAGRVVSELVDREYDAGQYSVAWDGTNDSGAGVASGVYFLGIQVGGAEARRKMVLVR